MEHKCRPPVLFEFSGFLFRLDNELNTLDFMPKGFYKLADAMLKPDERFTRDPGVNPILYLPVPGLEESYKKYKELVYILSIDGKVTKIGGTKTGLKKRHGSYECGNRRNREKGTCSTTNFNVTEAQYASIVEGAKVEWFAFDVPVVTAELNVFGEEHTVKTSLFTKYESVLMSRYEELTGHKPLLSMNSGAD